MLFNQIVKYVIFPVILTLVLMSCGQQPTEDQPFDANAYIQSVDLNKDTVTMDVETALTPQDFLEGIKGKGMISVASPINFNDIKRIWLITRTTNGDKYLLGVSTTYRSGSSGYVQNVDRISTLEPGDFIGITDIKNSNLGLGIIEFQNNPSITIHLDLTQNGSQALADMGEIPRVLRIFFHFERK